MSHNTGGSWWDQSYRKLLPEDRRAGSVSSQPFLSIYKTIVPQPGFLLSPLLAALSTAQAVSVGIDQYLRCSALLSNVVIITQRAFSNTIIFILSSSPSDHIRGLETFNCHNNRERYLFARRNTVTPSHLAWLIISLQFPVMIQLIAIVGWRCTYWISTSSIFTLLDIEHQNMF